MGKGGGGGGGDELKIKLELTDCLSQKATNMKSGLVIPVYSGS